MKTQTYFVLFFICFALITNLSVQSQTSLFQNYKSKTELLDQLYRNIQQRGESDQINEMIKVQEIILLKAELSSLKQEIKGSNPKQHEQIYHLRSTNLDGNFELLDFYVYDYATDYYRIVARLRCKTKIYTDFVKLEYELYNNNSPVGEDYSYIDYESYGYSGMLPYHISFFEAFTDKVDFDSIALKISYWIENGAGDILWDQIMELESNQIVVGTYLNEWSGTVKNKSNYAVTFPKIFACIFKNDSMIGLDYAYLDLETQTITTAIIYSVTTSPSDSEQVTLKNEANINIDISGWTIGDKDNPIAYTFPQGTVLSANAQKKISHNQLGFEIDDLEERVYLKDDQGITIDTWEGNIIIYSVTKSPTDSEQVTIKNCDIKNVDLSNWTIGDKNNPTAYKISQGTILLPKKLIKFTHNELGFQIDDTGEIIYLKDDQNNSVDIWEDNGATTGDVRIYSITTTPTESEQVTIKNYDISSVDISGWTIGDKNDPTAYNIPLNTVLSPGELKKFTHSQLGFGINDKDEIIYLKNQVGILIDIWYGPRSNLLANYQEKFYPNSTATFNSYIDLPADYDKIRYYLHYALYSLEGSGNITSNWPTYTELKYSGSERITLNFDMFLIDHENDQIQVQIDWNDNSNLIWQGPFYSRSVVRLSHNFPQAGTYFIQSKSKDRINSETNLSDSIKVEILPIPGLKITTQQLKAGIYKKIYNDTLKAEGGITPYRWALSSGTLPTGLNLNQNTGEIFGIPSASGLNSFCIRVTDGGNPSVSDTSVFQIIINNNPPQLNSASSINIDEHEELRYIARAIDLDGNAVSYNFENYPRWLIPVDSTISGIVPEGAKDTCFTVIASDGELLDTLIVNVTVTPVNDPPKIISPGSVSAIEDSVFQYTANAIDPEGDKITYIFKDCPKWLTPSDSTISGIPLEGTQDTSFIVIASDGKLKDSIKVSITLIPINDPPKLVSAMIDTAYEDLIFNYVAKATDPEHDEINYTFKNYPTWLEPNDSNISGIPLEATKDSCFIVIASDTELSDTLQVLIKVIPINDPPQIISPNNVNAYEDSLCTYTAKAMDPEHDEITFTFKNYPHWMTPSDSTISGLAKKATIDTSFTVIASDGKLMDTLIVKVKFIEKNDPPKIISPPFATAYEDSLFKYAAKAIDPENAPIKFIFKDYPAWLTTEDSTISGTPTEGIGDTSFVIFASDGNLTDSLEVFIDVIPINDPPKLISPDAVDAYEDYVFQYTARAIDPESGKVTYTFKNFPNWLTPSDSTISGIPEEGTKDSSFVIIANDGELSDSLKISITVIPINDSPELISAKIDTAYEDLLFTYTAKAIDPENDKINFSFSNYPKWLTPSDSIITGIPREGAKDTSITVIAADNYLSDTLCVNIIVIPVNDPPQIIHLSNFEFKTNETYIINLDTCVMDEDHAVESLIWKAIPSDANLNMNMANHIVSFNAPNWTGATEVKFIVTDPEGASDSAIVNVTVELPSVVKDEENIIPKNFFLSQNYPNPFNPQTAIHFGVPKSSTVNIVIYNLKGEIVEELFRGRKNAGNHFVVWDAKNNPSGVYLVRFQAGEFVEIKKCMLIK